MRDGNVCVMLTLCAVICLGTPGCSRNPGPDEADSTEKIRIDVGLQPTAGLVFLAADQGYFAEEGLEVELVSHPSGKVALAAMLDGDGEVGITADVPLVFRSFGSPGFHIVAQIASSGWPARIIARADHGIREPKDLRGKRIGTQKASAVHFFLHVFLLLHGLSEKSAETCFYAAADLPDALIRGKVDAMSMREPYVSLVAAQLGTNAVILDARGIYFRTEVVLVKSALIETRPQVVEKLVRSLLRAETLLREQPNAAAGILGRTFGIDAAGGQGLIERHELEVRLDHSLLTGLEDIALWALDSGLVENDTLPNYGKILYPDGLLAVSPERVLLMQ